MKRISFGFILCLLGLLGAVSAYAQTDAISTEVLSILPPVNVQAYDTPNDAGKSITVEWEASATPGVIFYEILRKDATASDADYVTVGQIPGNGFHDYDVEKGIAYQYAVRSLLEDSVSSLALASEKAIADDEWFNTDRVAVLISTIAFIVLVLWFVMHARRGKDFFIRKIAGLQEVDNALGRATEMGRPILYVPGLSSIEDVATIAGLNILGRVAQKCAEYETRLFVPIADYIVLPIAQEIVRESYTTAGRPDAFREEDVFFVTNSQFAYVASVNGLMMREKTATNFYMGMFWAESLLLTETGAQTGAVQIAGTDADAQLPFFITTCDYTLIGEELYAASAYLSREPLLMGTLKAQDYGKALMALAVVVGTILSTLGYRGFQNWFPSE